MSRAERGIVLLERVLEKCLAEQRHSNPFEDRRSAKDFTPVMESPGVLHLCRSKYGGSEARVYYSFCSERSGDHDPYFWGVAETPVNDNDRIVVPVAWNSGMEEKGSEFCYRALVLTPTCDESFAITGVAWVSPPVVMREREFRLTRSMVSLMLS